MGSRGRTEEGLWGNMCGSANTILKITKKVANLSYFEKKSNVGEQRRGCGGVVGE